MDEEHSELGTRDRGGPESGDKRSSSGGLDGQGRLMNFKKRCVNYLDNYRLSIYSNYSSAMIGVIVADSWTRIPFMAIILLAAMCRESTRSYTRLPR